MTTDHMPDDAAAQATERDPLEHPYGLFVADEETSIHLWFTDAAEALRIYVMSHLLVYILDADDAECRIAVRGVLDRALAAGQTVADVADELNRITGDESQIRWYGTFDSLLSGDSAHARELRSAFRDESDELDDEGLFAPIATEKIGEFAGFVRGYGF